MGPRSALSIEFQHDRLPDVIVLMSPIVEASKSRFFDLRIPDFLYLI